MKTKLYLDGEEVPLNDFVEKFFAKVLEGAVDSLKRTDSEWKKLNISVERG
jgi:hypothetical protein